MLPNRLNKTLIKLVEMISIFSIIMLTVVLFVEVLARYIFQISIPEIEVVRKFCVTWLVFLGAALAVKDKQHLEVDIFDEYLNKSASRIKSYIVYALTLAAIVILVFIGYAAFQAGLNRRELIPISFLSFRPTLTYYYVAFLLGSFFMLYFHLLNGRELIKSVKSEVDEE